MSSKENPIKLRALLLALDQLPQLSRLLDGVNELQRAVWELDGRVSKYRLSEKHSDQAEQGLKDALQDLKKSIQNPREKVIIYYGGHACLMGSSHQHQWRWLA
ncbi:hypothetical protein CLAFUW4_07267 [Fulvia fulva]|uniref:Uncharacterized protein n=1 Tax=Passalora fulva TaxID=5499 RepID=A0A9Q8PAA7_PASFU|nr:uncharacterized protein CLAFUR5_07398 [Fulvia fulva]KAK4622028.1 hypothetical protein CLAFUR4_07275 [Fulvia fulva]KAK4622692.1 hypothetical protein CLAFUR0_07273 [Fulvia fulva]UJO18765.1 hypothetical protein CLAFUR5_07398 [Fulvia fulva]WPV16005.1 hypothetical protein CLAFUW4_07267 [Fulvia fulva]WPV31004.1 hypothetical protein CLAFUW7_07269 [Fulvia fulva]